MVKTAAKGLFVATLTAGWIVFALPAVGFALARWYFAPRRR